ncbi:MAG TPA: M20/M25/M40 family metallo-hydrolase, partial [Aggregatilineales bacterium]|nr:M20/M25/M40 family metallo-hydrolase [Aggregatilineales bacterium]
PTLDELYIDTGLPAADVAALVRIGDLVTLEQTPFSLGENLLSGKAMDDRACLAAITVMLDHLSRRLHEWDVLAVAAVQEEVGANAMVVETAHLKPDIGIALDVTFATQPGVIGEGAFKLGAGVPISLGANFHPALYEAIREAAKRLEMELPVDPLPMHSGTDAWDVQVAGEGVPTALLNLPIRNMHTAIETVHLTDVTRLGRLLAEFVCGLTPEFMATIVWEKAKEENPS